MAVSSTNHLWPGAHGCGESESEVRIYRSEFTKAGIPLTPSLGWKKLDPRIEEVLRPDMELMAEIKLRMLAKLDSLQAEGIFTPGPLLDASSNSTQGVLCYPGGWTFIH